jgi:hypothetical protein
MKKSIISVSIIASCIMAFFMMSSFKTNPSASVLNSQTFSRGVPITIISSNTISSDGINYTGDVELEGAINASGTYVMPTQVLGMALHCTFILDLPAGDI